MQLRHFLVSLVLNAQLCCVAAEGGGVLLVVISRAVKFVDHMCFWVLTGDICVKKINP